MKSFYLYICLSAFVLFLPSCKSKKVIEKEEEKVVVPEPTSEFGFVTSDDVFKVLDQAKAEDKLVFLYMYFDKCPPCKLMEEYVFTDKELGKYFKEHFVTYKVDIKKGNGPDLATLFNTDRYPTILFLDVKGHVIEQQMGKAIYQTELKKIAERALLAGGKKK